MEEMSSQRLLQGTIVPSLLLAATLAPATMRAQQTAVGDDARGKAFFQISCAVCHSPVLGSDNTVIMKQGPSLVGVVGRPAGSLPHFNYTKAIRASGLSSGIIDAGLSRGLAGISGSTLVVNLAGSRYAVRDGMATLNPLAASIIGQLSSLEI